MRLYGSIKKLVANMFARQASAPGLDEDSDALYSDTDGNLIYRSDNATVETEQYVALRSSKTAFNSNTIDAVSGTSVTVAGIAIDSAGGTVDGIDVSAHAASTTAHGATGANVGTTNTQTLTNKDIDGGTASDTNRITLPKNTKSNLDGLTRKEATIVYATDLASAFLDNGSSLIPVGSGSESGEKNYIENPSAAVNTDGWVAGSVNISISRATTSTPTLLPREFTTKTALGFSSDTDEAYVRYRFSLDDVDLNRKLKIALALRTSVATWRIEMHSNASSDYSGAYTEISLSTDASGDSYLPATTTTYVTSFDSASSPYLELRIVHNGAVSDGINVSDVIVGPGTIIQGAVVGDGISYIPSSIIGFGSVTAEYFSYNRVGSKLFVTGKFTPGTTTATTARVSLPDNLTISTPSSTTLISGRWARQIAAATTVKAGVIQVTGGTNYVTFGLDDYTSGGVPLTAYNGNVICDSGEVILLYFSCDIAEWIGSGTVNLAQNDVEYAYNTSGITAANTSDSTSFGYGPVGAAIGSIDSEATGTANTIMRVRFNSVIQPTDIVTVEIQTNGVWVTASQRFPSIKAANAFYGILMAPVNSTDVDVYFGNAGGVPYGAATYGATGQAWSNFATQRWRVRKISAGAAVGFGSATSTSSGLIDTQAQTISGNKSLSGFTQLGNSAIGNGSAVGIKVIEFHGTFVAGAGTGVITHGLGNLSKVIAIMPLLNYDSRVWETSPIALIPTIEVTETTITITRPAGYNGGNNQYRVTVLCTESAVS